MKPEKRAELADIVREVLPGVLAEMRERGEFKPDVIFKPGPQWADDSCDAPAEATRGFARPAALNVPKVATEPEAAKPTRLTVADLDALRPGAKVRSQLGNIWRKEEAGMWVHDRRAYVPVPSSFFAGAMLVEDGPEPESEPVSCDEPQWIGAVVVPVKDDRAWRVVRWSSNVDCWVVLRANGFDCHVGTWESVVSIYGPLRHETPAERDARGAPALLTPEHQAVIHAARLVAFDMTAFGAVGGDPRDFLTGALDALDAAQGGA